MEYQNYISIRMVSHMDTDPGSIIIKIVTLFALIFVNANVILLPGNFREKRY